ncbi:PstS family phosphate ABC transporter substrate-binding protein [uncultured Vibrio sp.]|uniref:PstS family phosphate ABC transporter substrate-binding protein n=1 Tax=uncultured Vibrio sp. TaxID=114054 RepID=UPI0025F724F5|nr:PstS family phosphate ABC transporter substrate-binding protein [uncultured Vibrio sp.]
MTAHDKTKLLILLALTILTSQIAHAKNLIKIDGSSTVFPITNAIAGHFMTSEKGETQVAIGINGTGGGFNKFCRGDIDIANASRPIKPKEVRLCAQNGINFIELPIALDAVTVVVNKQNTWAHSMTVEELKTAWSSESEGKVQQWKDLNDAYPDRTLSLYGPGSHSGTYDFFVNVIVGDSSRKDYRPNEDDNVLAQNVANDINAMAFFGLAYYQEHKEVLKAVAISWKGGQAVLPDAESAASGLYQPLSRPIFIYVNTQSAKERAFVRRFLAFYLNKQSTPEVVKQAGYVPLPSSAYDSALATFNEK